MIAALRRVRFTGPEISELLDTPLSTVSGILTRIGMGKLGRLGQEPAQRYERVRPGELIHIDVRSAGSSAAPATASLARTAAATPAPSLTSRQTARQGRLGVRPHRDRRRHPLSYAEVLPDEKAITAIGFLRRAVRLFQRHGVTVEQLLTDNGSPYISTIHAIACRTLGIRHLRTRPRCPQTNGKAERFIRTLQAGWAYGATYRTSAERTAALDGWLWHYNHHRKHAGIGRQTPATRLNNLLGLTSSRRCGSPHAECLRRISARSRYRAAGRDEATFHRPMVATVVV